MTPASALVALVVAPGVLFAVLALLWLLGLTPGERFIARSTAVLYLALTGVALWLGWFLWSTGQPSVYAEGADWFQSGEYRFNLSLLADHLSWPLLTVTVMLVGLVGAFSVRYLHRDRGYFRFFALLHLFCFGSMLVLAAGTYDLLLGGWELVGISSVLLVAFFDERREPVRNAVRVFAFYRIADLGLLIGIFLLHHSAHTTGAKDLFHGAWPNDTANIGATAATAIGLMLLMAAAGKSAQAPFSGWLPRAMEGPTPSSAIFYGAISVHLGAYLLLRSEPIFRQAPIAAAAVGVVGGVTAVLASIVHRSSTDAKTSLAYAGMAQLGIIFVEIAAGFPQLALFHIMGHAVVRTLQFLRAPSMLHDYHRVHAAAGGHLGKTGEHYVAILPGPVRVWIYRAAVERMYYDGLLDRLVVGPVLRLARALEAIEEGAAPATPGQSQPAARLAQGVES
ncbi:MAG: proton-conducting transporter membrane subunit [Bryobacteraceae bacterium]